jgi:dTDP-4-amino-4,6-dideoxygalactose transaminase
MNLVSTYSRLAPDEVGGALDRLAEVLASGCLTLGPLLAEFEQGIAALAGVSHAAGVSSGTSAVEMALRALNVRDRVVLVPASTNYATAIAAVNAGARVEVYDSGLYPALDDLLPRLRGEVAAVVVVHLGGYVSPELPQLLAALEDQAIPVVEDAAQAHGAKFDGRSCGTFGKAGAFSFYPSKVLTCGEGGAVVTDDAGVDETVRRLRDQGMNPQRSEHLLRGYNWRLSELAAALGLAQLPNFERDCDRRNAIISRYCQELSELPGFSLLSPDPRCEPAGYRCFALADSPEDRDRLIQHGRRAGFAMPEPVYSRTLLQQPALFGLPGDDSTARDWAARNFCLPLSRSLTDDDVDQVIATFQDCS